MNEPPPDSSETKAVLRILDANANRAAEALRVTEEYCRFALNAPALSQVCKELRHDLADALDELPTAWLLQSRDVVGDVGAQLATPQEYQRGAIQDVAAASSKRLEQSLRALEEYGKVISASFARRVEPLRYRAYELSRRVVAPRRRHEQLNAARLYLLLDGRQSADEFVRLAVGLAPLVDVIQLRDKRLSDRKLLERARLLQRATADTDVLFIVNDRPDIAMLAGADGVHVGQDELPIRDVRRLLDEEMVVGVSTHNLEQAKRAQWDEADYIGCGPVFISQTKSFDEYAGVNFLEEVSGEIDTPAFAIGGIAEDNLAEVTAAGFGRVAVSDAILSADNPASAAKALREQLCEKSKRNA